MSSLSSESTTSTTTLTSSIPFSTTYDSEAEVEAIKKRLADRKEPYYYGYDIEKEANEIVYPVLTDKQTITLNEARGRGLRLYPKRNVYIVNKISNMVAGMEEWPIESIYPVANEIGMDEDLNIRLILEDLEKRKGCQNIRIQTGHARIL